VRCSNSSESIPRDLMMSNLRTMATRSFGSTTMAMRSISDQIRCANARKDRPAFFILPA